MNTQLKKGDKCQSPWGVVEVTCTQEKSEIRTVMKSDGCTMLVSVNELTHIPSHAERMQAILDIAWDVENRLKDDETVQLKVGAFVEFARHYVAMKDELEECVEYLKTQSKEYLAIARDTEKLLKGEL